MEIFDSRVSRALTTALDGLSLRQQVASNNLANVDTPGFKAGAVDFESRLAAALGRSRKFPMANTDSRHYSFGGGDLDTPVIQVSPAVNTTARADGNNVDIDRQMAELAETTINYNAMASLMASRLANLRSVITGGMR